MKIFPIDKIIPKTGFFKPELFENKDISISPTLFYKIWIELEPFEMKGEMYETNIFLEFIRLNINKIKELENTKFEFPINPWDWYIDGSIYLFHVHNPIDVTNLSFGKIENGKIATQIIFNIDFEFESTGYFNLYQQIINIDLYLDSLVDSFVIKH